jgi:hypothetical protein
MAAAREAVLLLNKWLSLPSQHEPPASAWAKAPPPQIKMPRRMIWFVSVPGTEYCAGQGLSPTGELHYRDVSGYTN